MRSDFKKDLGDDLKYPMDIMDLAGRFKQFGTCFIMDSEDNKLTGKKTTLDNEY